MLYKLKLVYPYPLEKKDTPMQHRQNIHPEISSTCFLFPFKALNLNYFQDCLFLQKKITLLAIFSNCLYFLFSYFLFCKTARFSSSPTFLPWWTLSFFRQLQYSEAEKLPERENAIALLFVPKGGHSLVWNCFLYSSEETETSGRSFLCPTLKEQQPQMDTSPISSVCFLQFQFICHSLDPCTMYIALSYRSCPSYQLFCLKLKHKPYKQINNKSRTIWTRFHFIPVFF